MTNTREVSELATRKRPHGKVTRAAAKPAAYLLMAAAMAATAACNGATGGVLDDPHTHGAIDNINATQQGRRSRGLELHTGALTSLGDGAFFVAPIPGVVRPLGQDTFRIEASGGPSVTGFELRPYNLGLSGVGNGRFVDDGTGADRVAGDRIFTLGPLAHVGAMNQASLYGNPHSPMGMDFADIGSLTVRFADGTTSESLLIVQLGLLGSDVELVRPVRLGSQLQTSPHFINVKTAAGIEIQSSLRQFGGQVELVTEPIYEHFPDVFDYFHLVSTYRVELLPRVSGSNFNAGLFLRVGVDFDGTGLWRFNSASAYGSAGRLKGLSHLDAWGRGVTAQNSLHEILHQWAAYVSGPLIESGGHYVAQSSVGSLVGGFRWLDNGDGTFTRDLTVGRNGAYEASPLDKYLAGWIGPESVPPMRVSRSDLPASENLIRQEDVVATVTIDDIIAAHGPRIPGPVQAQRHFGVGFVAETTDRFMTDVEMTFYDRLAMHWGMAPTSSSPPLAGQRAWVPAAGFFGEGTTWTTQLPPPIARGDVFQETNGLVVFEAESEAATATRGATGTAWKLDTTLAGSSGPGYMTTDPAVTGLGNASAESLTYKVAISSPGDYFLWARRQSQGGGSNSMWVEIDGVRAGNEFDNGYRSPTFSWHKHPVAVPLTTGEHYVTIRRRESGYAVDRLLLSNVPSYAPTGIGPASSPTVDSKPFEVSVVKVATGKSYQAIAGGVAPNQAMYIDRAFGLGISADDPLVGTTLLRTANSDKLSTSNAHLSFVVNRRASVIIAMDTRLSPPSWLDTFEAMGRAISGGSAGTFNLYRRTYPAGQVVLGGNAGVSAGSMYFVMLEEAPVPDSP